MDEPRRLYDRFYDPAYTGRTQRVACAAVSAVLAAFAAGVLALVSLPLAAAAIVAVVGPGDTVDVCCRPVRVLARSREACDARVAE